MEIKHQQKQHTTRIEIKKKNKFIPVLAGSIAGGIEIVCIWPMEMIKTNLQLGTMKSHYNGMTQGFKYHIKTDGILSLYRGLTPILISTLPKAGIRFGSFEACKNYLADSNGITSATGNFIAGLVAGAAEASIVTAPAETVKTKLIDANKGLLSGISLILKNEGVRGLYQGVTPTILKQGSNQGFRFMWFSEFKRYVPSFLEKHGIIGKEETELNKALVSLAGGMSAGCFSVFGNNPFDVIKTRMQGLNASQYKNTFDCGRQIIKNEGIKALYTGIIPRLGRVVPGQGIIFVSYDTILRFIQDIA